MAVASAVNPTTVQAVANLTPDPRRVVTPLNPDRAEELLCKYGISSPWRHVIIGLHEGFDIGICEHLSRSYIFRQSHLVSIRPRFYHIIYFCRTSCWSLLRAIPSG
jgi:hypothetical protein